jgi:chorismate-pyruvate lyase
VTPIQRILLTADGSITRILEALTGKEVKVETVEQKVVKANREVAGILDIDEGDDINFRVVNLKAGGEILVHAVSNTPLKRLDERFRDDLMSTDIPIGKIIRKHNLEVRREINWGKVEKAGRLGSIFRISESEQILSRNYNIIHRNRILINITEYFPARRFG